MKTVPFSKMQKLQCIICEKELRSLAEAIDPLCCIEGGGVIDVHMGYGSSYDQAILWEPAVSSPEEVITKDTKWKRVDWAINSDNKLRNLMACNKVRGCICDECLEKKQHLFKGYWTDDNEKFEKVVD